jgi:threonine synthase
MGLPVGKLVCASNTNKVLTDFFESGVYNKNRSFYITKSPSMDILISSNLERLLYLTCGDVKCAEYMAELKEKGEYTLAKAELDKIRTEFDAGFCDDTETVNTIEKVYNEYGYLMDTHTAVAWNVYEKWAEETGNKDKTVVLSTASPYKFSNSVMKALGKSYNGEFDALKKLNEYTGAKVPASLENIENKAVFHNVTVEKNDMLEFVSGMVNKKVWHE